MRYVLLLLCLPWLAACASSDPAPTESGAVAPVGSGGASAALARVLELEDTRATSGWEELLADPAVRDRAVLAIARTRDARLGPLLQRAATSSPFYAFALGQLGDEGAAAALCERDPRALEALGKLDDPRVTPYLISALDDHDPEVVGQALLALVRLRGRRVKPPRPFGEVEGEKLGAEIAALLLRQDETLKWRAAYALSELPLPKRLERLSKLTSERSWRVRLFGVRGLTRVEGHDAERADVLDGLLIDDSVHVAAAAATALGQCGGAKVITPLLGAVKRHSEPNEHHLRHAAVEALAAIAKRIPGLREKVLPALVHACSDASPRVVEAAWRGRAGLEPRVVFDALRPLAESGKAAERELAARVAGSLSPPLAWQHLQLLAADAEPRVVAAALESLAGLEGLDAAQLARLARAAVGRDRDVAETGDALALLAKVGTAADAELLAGCISARPEDAERSGAALEALGGVLTRVREREPAAREALDARARELLGVALESHPSPTVRGAAGRAWRALWPEVPTPPFQADRGPPLRSTVTLEVGVDVGSDAPLPRVALHTSKGKLVLELLREAAPRHVKSFLTQVEKGTYTGTTFHRVISGFVAQGLDPHGDGWGTGGVFLRDEITPVPFLRGTVGMPNAGPDSGGCQLFICHVPTPHLDGAYTVFGRVVEGLDVLDALDVGDAVQRVEVLPAS
ncbi:MAG: peptidylprolyl isomerase [Planctomycetota bacterium]